jgi:hypothetical protein
MLFEEIIIVYSENHMKPTHKYKMQGYLLTVKAGSTYSYHYALKG